MKFDLPLICGYLFRIYFYLLPATKLTLQQQCHTLFTQNRYIGTQMVIIINTLLASLDRDKLIDLHTNFVLVYSPHMYI